MTKVKQKEKAIEMLQWDNEIKADSDAGKLDFMVKEAGDAKIQKLPSGWRWIRCLRIRS